MGHGLEQLASDGNNGWRMTATDKDGGKIVVKAKDASLNTELSAKLDATVTAMAVMKARAESVEAYDQMIGENNEAGNAVVQAAIDGLIAQTRVIERVVTTLGYGAIDLEGSDSLDAPGAVFE